MTTREIINRLQRQIAYNYFHPNNPIDTTELKKLAWDRGISEKWIFQKDKKIESMIWWEILFCFKDVIDFEYYKVI